MGRREQFAGWGLYDNVAVCATCRHKHLIPRAEQIHDQPWLDWLTKHPGHETFIVPYGVLKQLDQLQELRHNADVKIAYAASAAYTITLTSLATSATFVAGQESTALSNTTNKYLDVLVGGKIRTHATVAPTAGTIEVHAVGAVNDTPTYPDVFDGTDSAETVTSADIKAAVCRLIAAMGTDATTGRTYWFGPSGIRQLFGDGLPSAHVLFVTHNTVQALSATAGDHVLNNTPVYATVI